jgi:disulfide bond formation protein DsbB
MYDTTAKHTTSTFQTRLTGLAGAVRFAWIPMICALVVAIASPLTSGRVLAAALALLSLAIGVAVHAREIALGQPLRVLSGPALEELDAEWAKAIA